MYEERYSEIFVKKLIKIKKKDPTHFKNIRKKIDDILEKPHAKYKFLHHSMKGINRVHIGHFVLVFIIDHVKKSISFEDYDHHDKIYK